MRFTNYTKREVYVVRTFEDKVDTELETEALMRFGLDWDLDRDDILAEGIYDFNIRYRRLGRYRDVVTDPDRYYFTGVPEHPLEYIMALVGERGTEGGTGTEIVGSLRRYLDDSGFRVVVVDSGQQSVETIERVAPSA